MERVLLLLDLSAALDSTDCKIFIYTLDRTFFAEIINVEITCVVPQGFIVGPLLFHIYVLLPAEYEYSAMSITHHIHTDGTQPHIVES